MIDKNIIFEVLINIIRNNGMICMHCVYRESNRCLHAEMKLNRTEKINIDGVEASLLDNFTIPHYDFFCQFWEGEK